MSSLVTFSQANLPAVSTLTTALRKLDAEVGPAGCAISSIVTSIALAIIEIGAEILEDSMTDAVYDTFQCILFCNISGDATFTEAAWQQVKLDITEQFSGDPRFVLWNVVNALGPVGLSNAARMAIAVVGDCDDCACEACDINAIYLHNFETDTWHLVEPETETTALLTSTSNGTREIIQFSFGAPNGEGDCCNISAYEQTDGNPIFIVDYMDCAGETFSQALPTAGCRRMVTIYSNVEPEPPMTWRITLAEECV